MHVETTFQLLKRGGQNAEASKNVMGGAENHACRPEDDGMSFEGSRMKEGRRREQRVWWQRRDGWVRGRRWSIIDCPASRVESVDKAEVLLLFGAYGIWVAGFNGVSELDNADVVMPLNLSEDARSEKGCRTVLPECRKCESLNDEHIRAKAVTIGVRGVWKNPLGNTCCMSTRRKGIGGTCIEDGKGGTTGRRVMHYSLVNQKSSLVVAVDDELLHFGMRA
jgi:hypothetical protein